jgi:ACS family sodium-dependent inorganic phosphate cotransporter
MFLSFFSLFQMQAGALTSGGVSCNHFDIAPKNAGTVYAIGNTVSCVAGLIAVPLSGYLYQTSHSWDTVFLVFAGHYIGGALLYNVLASDQRIACDRDDMTMIIDT